MASFSSLFSLLFLVILLSAFSIPAQSQKTTQLARRHLKVIDQESEKQPTPKPQSKKKLEAPVEKESEEDQPIPKPKSKKKLETPVQKESEEDQPISKPKPKKKLEAPFEKEPVEDQPISKPKSKKKLEALIEKEPQEDKPISKLKTKKKLEAPLEKESEGGQPIPKPKSKKKLETPIEKESDADQPITKPKTKKKIAVQEEEDKPAPKLKTKKKTAELGDDEAEQPISKPKKKKDPNFESKNQTKPLKPKKTNSTASTPVKALNSTKKAADPNPDPIWGDDPESDSDLIAEFRELPTRIHEALIPDLRKISITSKAYIYRANKNIADNVKPFVGNKFAPKIAAAASCAFLVLPLCLVTLIFYHLNSYLPLHRLLVFVQAYLAIYFFTLALTGAVTGLEPLRFFYATSPSSYAWTQAVQTLGYVLYLLAQLIHLVVVFSAGESKAGVRALGLAQMVVGLAVGCHYYASVFHRAVTGDPPRANWKVHGVYAGCFLLICLCARAERRKKGYDGGEDGKKS